MLFLPVPRERLGRLVPQGLSHVHKVWTNLWNRGSPRAGADPRQPPVQRRQRDVQRAVIPVDNDSELAAAWQHVIDELQPNQQAWVRTSEAVTLHGNTAIIAVGDELTRTQLEGRLRGQLEDALTVRFGHEIRLAVTVNPALAERVDTAQTGLQGATVDQSTSPHVDMSTDLHVALPPVHESATRPAPGETRLNPKYAFETFVIGSSNRFPHAAAVAVAEAPGKATNPLLVYGDSGLGKTHLLHAIGHCVRSLYSEAKVRYVSS